MSGGTVMRVLLQHAQPKPHSEPAIVFNYAVVAHSIQLCVVKRRGARSLVDDLTTGQGVVSSRAVFTLRSVETTL